MLCRLTEGSFPHQFPKKSNLGSPPAELGGFLTWLKDVKTDRPGRQDGGVAESDLAFLGCEVRGRPERNEMRAALELEIMLISSTE